MSEKSGPNDAQLVRAYLAGNARAFEKLYKRYERPLFSFLLRFVHQRATAEDLFQQTWMKVINGLENYEERGSFSSWLFGIAYHCSIDHTRKAVRSRKDEMKSEDGMDKLEGEMQGPDEQLIEQEQRQWLHQAIGRLPREQREVLLLRIHGEVPFKEIAEMMQCPLNTVLGRMHYAVLALKKMIPHSTEDPIHVLS